MNGVLTDEIRAKALDASPCELITFEADTLRILGANDRVLENLGHSFPSLVGMALDQILCSATRGIVLSRLMHLGTGTKDSIRCNARHLRSDGSTYDVSIDLRFADDSKTTILATAVDITEQRASERRATTARNNLQAAIEALPHGFVLFDDADRLVTCNERYREFYPNSAASMVPGATFEEILRHGLDRGEYPDGIGREEAWLGERLSQHRAASETLQQRLADGRILQIIERPTPDGGRVGVRIDITQYVNSRERAERAEQRLLDAISALPAGFWLFDDDDRLVMFNERFRKMYSTSADWLVQGRTYEEILRGGLESGQYPEAIGREQDWLADMLDRRKGGAYELVYQLDDDRWIHSLNEPTSEGGLVGFRVDITELKQRQEELEEAASSDPLTGLLNRRGISDFLEQAGDTLQSDEELSFLHIDLDKFKAVNDVHGHASGDALLVHVAGILRESAGEFDRIARIGGDEFLICLKAPLYSDKGMELAEHIRDLISRPVHINGKSCHVGASIGLASWYRGSQQSLSEAMQNADIALNTSKSQGRNRVALFEQFMRENSVRAARVAEQVASGLNRGEFIAFFQPQLDCRTLEPIGFECLARWQHPQKGITGPGEFLPACDAAGMTPVIDKIVLDHALNFARQLDDRGWSKLHFGINISSAQLKDPEIVYQYLWRLSRRGLTPDRFRIEILESTLLDQRASHIGDNIKRFAREGFLVDLDDFGTGHTAIASLREYPVSRIKIDRSLIKDVDREPDLEKLTGAVVALGRGLGIEVVAEGIEREGEHDTALRLGCNSVQGFLFAKPMPADECLTWLESGWQPHHDHRAAGAASTR